MARAKQNRKEALSGILRLVWRPAVRGAEPRAGLLQLVLVVGNDLSSMTFSRRLAATKRA